MKRVAAIARLTFAEGVRMRIVLGCLLILVFLVVRMPFTLRGDETLTGRLQNFLAYGLGALSLLLSVATIFFSCATLTTEIRERSLHLVLAKPVSRFEILLGKWLGINLLNVVIVAVCGVAIYGFARYIKARPEQFSRDSRQLRDVVWTARAAATPVQPTTESGENELQAAARQKVRQLLDTAAIPKSEERAKYNELLVAELAQWRTIPPGYVNEYEFRNLRKPERDDTVMQVRYKARATPLSPDEMVLLGWQFLDPATGRELTPIVRTIERSSYVHHFLVQAAPIIRNGAARVRIFNLNAPQLGISVYFDGDDSLQLLYRVGGFEPNYINARAMILLKLALLSAIGLFFSAFVSFPVACLCTGAFFLICAASPFILDAIGAHTQMMTPDVDPYGRFGPAVRKLLVPFLESVFPDFSSYSGTQQIVNGEYIAWGRIGRTILRTLLYGGVLLLVPGWYIFERREIAQVTV
ncbi:MAG: ABC transporter permease subunit [Planctomycetota bacterium]